MTDRAQPSDSAQPFDSVQPTSRRARVNGPFLTRRGLLSAGSGLLGGLALTSCASGLPDPVLATAGALPADAQITTINPAALKRMVQDISKVLQQADEKRDATGLETRVTGPALEQRKALYTWWKAAEGDRPTPEIKPKPLADTINISVASSATKYPRELVLVANSPETTDFSANYILLALRQANARENYRVWAGINLMVPQPDPNVEFLGQGAKAPKANTQIGPDDSTLVRSPRDAVSHYLDVLNKGAKSEFAEEFFADAFQTKVALLRRQYEVAVKGAPGAAAGAEQYLKSATVEFSTDFANFTGLITEDKKALVIVQVKCVSTLENADASSKLQVFLPKFRALAGAKEWQNKLVIEDTLVGAFTIPVQGTEDPKVRCIGFDADLGEGLGQSVFTFVEDQAGPAKGETISTLTQTSTDGPGDGWGATKVIAS